MTRHVSLVRNYDADSSPSPHIQKTRTMPLLYPRGKEYTTFKHIILQNFTDSAHKNLLGLTSALRSQPEQGLPCSICAERACRRGRLLRGQSPVARNKKPGRCEIK